ncbi:hypothetical protein OHB00_26865 [Streptomyces sp. NBC_00631]|uniref:hypothetical protein n=1 Tax=Streptomyces sp. NBC_00631 TaxID=2975793 RepID=UPI0030E29323
MALTMEKLGSEELFLAPGEPRAFAFGMGGAEGTAFFSEAFPTRPQSGKQSLWTIAHGIETDGVVGGGEFREHDKITHWVTVQVADPQIPTPFRINTVVFFE